MATRPSTPAPSGRCVRAASPSPGRAAGSSDRSAGRSRSGRTCPSAARAAPASANSRIHRPPGPPPGLRMPFGSNRAFTARISERLPGSSPQRSTRFSSVGEAFTTTAEPPRRPGQRPQLVEPVRRRGRAVGAQIQNAQRRTSGRERRAGLLLSRSATSVGSDAHLRARPPRPLRPRRCRSYSFHNDRSSSPATTTACAPWARHSDAAASACMSAARGRLEADAGRDAAATRSRWRKARVGDAATASARSAPARPLRTVATTVRETGASGASLNVALRDDAPASRTIRRAAARDRSPRRS